MWVKCNRHNLTDTDIFMVKYISILNLCAWVSAIHVLQNMLVHGNEFQIEIVVFKLKKDFTAVAMHLIIFMEEIEFRLQVAYSEAKWSGRFQSQIGLDCIVRGSCHQTIKFCIIIHSSYCKIDLVRIFICVFVFYHFFATRRLYNYAPDRTNWLFVFGIFS